MSDPRSLTEIGPYRIESRLGAGGMGEVYRAYDSRLDRSVAVKLIRIESSGDAVARERFRREARAAAGLSHPSIVQIYDILESSEGDALVMELVEGDLLSTRISRGALEIDECLRLGREIADGLATAHARKILHRDLKAENVLITRELRAKVLDFGLAKRVDDEAGDSLTRTGAVVGTFRAMSPEQARGSAVGARSDLFSFGVLLYEMLTGRSPFKSDSATDTLVRVCTVRQAPVRELRPEVPQDLSDLVDRLLEKDPAHRPRGAREVLLQLEAVASPSRLSSGSPGEKTLAEDRPLGPETSRQGSHLRFWRQGLGRYVLTAGVSALFLVCLGAGLMVLVRPKAGHPPARGAPPREEPATDAFQLFQAGMADLDRFDKKGNTDRAVNAFQRALALDPSSAAVYAGLSRAYWRKFLVDHDPLFLDQALAAARHAVSGDEHLAIAWVSLGLAESSHGHYAEAVQHFEKARTIEPANADAWRGLAVAYEAQEKLGDAEQAYKEAIRRKPGDRELHDLLGVLYLRTGRYQEAEASFRRSIERAPDSIYGYRNLAAAYYSQGRYDEAASQIQKALEIQPLPSLYTNLGTLLFFQGLYTQAVPAFQKALEVSGGAHVAQMWTNLGDAYRWTPDGRDKARDAYSQAIHMIRESLAAQPASVTLRSRLALCLAKRGDREEALAELRKLGPIAPADADTLYVTASAYEIAGRRGEALAALGQALNAGYSAETVRRDPELVRLRADPDYHRLLLAKTEGR